MGPLTTAYTLEDEMDKVKEMVAVGVSIPTAIKEALGMSYVDFAKKHRLNPTTARLHLGGHVRATDGTIDALVKELGGSEDEWRMLLWEAARPVVARSA